MLTKELVEYIRSERLRGVPPEAVSGALAAQGWSAEDVAAGFAASTPPPPTQTSPPPTSTPTHPVLLTVAYLAPALVVSVSLAAGGWYLSTHRNILASASVPELPSKKAAIATSAPAETATTTATSTEPQSSEPQTVTYSFIPKTSSIPAFSIAYPPELGTPTGKESAHSFTITLSTAMKLTFSLFGNPLASGQTPEAYLKSVFPNATTAIQTINDRTIARVLDPSFPQDKSLYYVFLKNASVLTVSATGDMKYLNDQNTEGNSTRDSIIDSIAFTDSSL